MFRNDFTVVMASAIAGFLALATTRSIASPPPGASAPVAALAPPQFVSAMDPRSEAVPAALGTSTLLSDVRALGIDVTQPMSKIAPGPKAKLMKLFTKALGYPNCNGCHAEGDLLKVTRAVKVSRKMWNDYVATLKDQKGNAIFCDTCHVGREHFLERADKAALDRYMLDEFTKKLAPSAGGAMQCETCHGAANEPKVITKVWHIAGDGRH